MARKLSQKQSTLRGDASRAAGNILKRRALKGRLPAHTIRFEHPQSHFGAAIRVVDAETRALIDAAVEARK